MNLERLVDDVVRGLGVGEDDPLGVACSGGGDSTALLHLLAHREPVVIHVDHGLRPDSAGDAHLVRRQADELGLDCEVVEVEVGEPGRIGPQAAARKARYEALERVARRRGLRWVATGHTQDDQAETALLGMLRGSGPAGIPRVRDIFIRPLLGLEREELRSWMTSRGITWLEDPSNQNTRFERSWLRTEIMPLLRERRPGVDKALASAARHARDDAEALDELARRVVGRLPVDDMGVLVPRAELDVLPAALERRVLRGALLAVDEDTGWKATAEEIEGLLGLTGHARIGRLDVWPIPDGLAVLRAEARSPEPLRLPRRGVVESADWGIRVYVCGSEPRARWQTKIPGTGEIVVRPRRPGDRVRTAAGSRKVQDVLVDAKVPRPLRDLVGVVASGEEALAVVGMTSLSDPTGPEPAGSTVAVEPMPGSWSREALWAKI